MNKQYNALFIILAIAFLSAPVITQAQEIDTGTTTEDAITEEDVTEVELPDAGILPDSPFYFLKRFSEGVGNVFAFTATQKAERYQKLAERRLSEARALAEQGKEELSARIIERYEARINSAIERAEEAQAQGRNVDDILARISERAVRHQEVLGRVLEQVPEQAKDAIQSVIENSTRNYERTVNRIEDLDAQTQVLHRLAPNIEQTKERLEELRTRGVPVPEEALRNVEEIRQRIQENPELRSRLEDAREVRDQICAQVITRARNPRTGEVRDFPTPCDVLSGWEHVREDQNAEDATSTDARPSPFQRIRNLGR